jgi:hypothetical protein
MKQLLSFLIISIIVLTGFGASAIQDPKTDFQPMQPNVTLTIRGGIGINGVAQSYGSWGFSGKIRLDVSINASILLWGGIPHIHIIDGVGVNERISFKIAKVCGFGLCQILVIFNVDNDPERQVNRAGLIFGPIVMIPSIQEQF